MFNHNHPQSNKTQQGKVKKMRLVWLHHEWVSYGHEIAAQAVISEWHAMGGQWIAVRETPCWESRWKPLFLDPSLSEEGGEIQVKKSKNSLYLHRIKHQYSGITILQIEWRVEWVGLLTWGAQWILSICGWSDTSKSSVTRSTGSRFACLEPRSNRSQH